jgi:hypothetical protein
MWNNQQQRGQKTGQHVKHAPTAFADSQSIDKISKTPDPDRNRRQRGRGNSTQGMIL